jgi:hypothetical protein
MKRSEGRRTGAGGGVAEEDAGMKAETGAKAGGEGPSLRDGGPLPRRPFRSFLATAGDPSPNFGGGVGRGASRCTGASHLRRHSRFLGRWRVPRQGRCRARSLGMTFLRRDARPERGARSSLPPPRSLRGRVGEGGAPPPARSTLCGRIHENGPRTPSSGGRSPSAIHPDPPYRSLARVEKPLARWVARSVVAASPRICAAVAWAANA